MQKEITISYSHCDPSQLPEEEHRLIESAIDAMQNSYSNYSHFKVGAAVLLNDGNVIIGANQENAAFPSGLCAERCAVFAAQSNYPDTPIKALAIAAGGEAGLTSKPISPCGACRQVILEVEDRYKQDIKILLYGTDGVYVFSSVKDLLPFSFIGDDMK